jgi:hypothetical protein
MRKWTVRAARAVLVGAAFAAVGAGIANADTDHNTTNGTRSLLGGLQTNADVPISVPNLAAGSLNNLASGNTVDASGNNLQLLSPRSTASSGSTHRLQYVFHKSRNIEATSLGSGDQAKTPVSAPILICGNAITDTGLGTAACHGNSSISGGAASSQTNPACSAACAPAAQAPAEPAKPAAPVCSAACAPAAQAPAEPAKPAAPVCSAACTQAQQPAKPAVPPAPACAQACTQVGTQACHEACTQSPAQRTDSSATHLMGRDQTTVTAPIAICGNAVPVRGLAAAACDGSASFTKS